MEQQGHILEKDNYLRFCNELDGVISAFPNFLIKESDGRKYIKGILDIPNANGKIAGSFLIEIHFTANYPYRFPDLYEVGGEIERHPDWHKYDDDRCCVTVPADEILKCKQGISLINFIEKFAIPFFANHLYRKLTGRYRNGEFGHSIVGPLQFYTELLKTNDIKLWKKYYEYCFEEINFKFDRNAPCFCGSKMKYKKCHRVVFTILNDIGKDQVFSDIKMISKYS